MFFNFILAYDYVTNTFVSVNTLQSLRLGTDKLKSTNNYTKKFFVINKKMYIFVVMKKLILSFSLLLISMVGYSQYLGPMNKELFDTLSTEERDLFVKCVKQTNISLDSMDWIQVNVKDSIYEKVRRDDGVNYYYNKKTIIYNSDNSNKVIDKFGKHNLIKPKFLIGIFKYPNGIIRVTLMMFY
jgi:hypothetical protein